MSDPVLDDEHEADFLGALQATTPGQVQRARAARKAAAAMVARYAPEAPIEVQLEAVIRTAGYLVMIRPGAARQRAQGNNQTSIIVPPGTSALRSSGAMGLLTPWRRRRALG